MSILRRLLVVGALLTATGCYNVTYMSKTRMPSAVQHEENLNFFFFGLAGERDVQAGQMCPNGIAKIHNQQTFLDMFLFVITIGIYTPRTVTVTCAQ